jgi:ankyrin repeat protein
MQSPESRQTQIELLAGNGNTDELKKLFVSGYTQLEIDTALENSIAYSQIKTADYLLSLGADFSNYNYQGTYYAVHNNELAGLKFAISKGVDININNGMLLNESVMTATNSKSVELIKWLLDNGANPKLLTKQSMKLADEYGTKELKSLLKNAT